MGTDKVAEVAKNRSLDGEHERMSASFQTLEQICSTELLQACSDRDRSANTLLSSVVEACEPEGFW
jgi:hypothetical protein